MTLTNVLEEICAKEYALPENAPRHRFSPKHRRAMNKILYPDNLPKAEKKLVLKRRVVIIAAIALLAVVTGAASIIRHGGFWFTKERSGGKKYLMMFAENAESAPKTIEKICYECNAPEKYQRNDRLSHVFETEVLEIYEDTSAVVPENQSKPVVHIMQITKESFADTINFDQEYTPIEIKGHNGFTVVSTHDRSDGTKYVYNTVIWDCGEYIHHIGGTISMEDMMSFIDGMTEI